MTDRLKTPNERETHAMTNQLSVIEIHDMTNSAERETHDNMKNPAKDNLTKPNGNKT